MEIGLSYYIARFYDPVIAHFIQADSLVPEAGSTVGYDRYAYVYNNPINLNDPTGNRACDDNYGPECRVVLKPKVATPSTSTVGSTQIQRNNTLSSGTIYTSTVVVPFSTRADSSLAAKAEETYTGFGRGPVLDYESITGAYRLFEAGHTAMSIANDMYYKPNVGNILIQLNWEKRETGLYLDTLTVKNYAPVALMIDNVEILNQPNKPISVLGPKDAIGINGHQPGVLSMPVNVYLSDTWDSRVRINFLVAGGYMNPPYKNLYFSTNINLQPGCSLLP